MSLVNSYLGKKERGWAAPLLFFFCAGCGIGFRDDRGTQIGDMQKYKYQNICNNHIESIVQALESYRIAHGRYPPPITYDAKGNVMHSWRALIMPYTDQGAFFQSYDFNQPWNSPHNRFITQNTGAFRAGRLYSCPTTTLPAGQPFDESHDYGLSLTTNYVMVTYNGKAIYDVKSHDSEIFHRGLAIVEICRSDIHWAEPRDVEASSLAIADSRDKIKKATVSSKDPDGPGIIWMDPSTKEIKWRRGTKGSRGRGAWRQIP